MAVVERSTPQSDAPDAAEPREGARTRPEAAAPPPRRRVVAWAARRWAGRQRLFTWAITCVIAGLVLATFAHDPGFNHYHPSNFRATIRGTAHKPFVYRALVPALVRVTTAPIPKATRTAMIEASKGPALAALRDYCDHIPAEAFPHLVVALAWMYAALLAFVAALRSLFDALYEGPRPWSTWVPVAALALLPVCFSYTSYVYDFAALFLFTEGLALLARRRLAAYLAVFAVACWNKETTILLSLVFGLHVLLPAPRAERRKLALHLGAQVALFAAAKLVLAHTYEKNGGGFVEHHLDHNVELLHPYPLSTYLAWLAAIGLVAYGLRDKPALVRRALWVLPVLVVATLFLGFADELRDYYEALPAVVIAMADGLARVLRAPLAKAGDAARAAAQNDAVTATPNARDVMGA